MSAKIKVENDEFVGVITLNRPNKLNVVTPEMTEVLATAVEDMNANDGIRCLIITGAGDRAFCAGSDISALDDNSTAWNFRNRPHYCDAIRALRKPVIAAINGCALGGGLEIALACDIRIASENATFGAPEIKLGWIGGGGMVACLAASIGQTNAALMLMTGDPIDAMTAVRRGLVSGIQDRRPPISHHDRSDTGPHNRFTRAYRCRNRQDQFAGHVRHVIRECHRLRARPRHDLFCYRGCPGRAPRLR